MPKGLPVSIASCADLHPAFPFLRLLPVQEHWCSALLQGSEERNKGQAKEDKAQYISAVVLCAVWKQRTSVYQVEPQQNCSTLNPVNTTHCSPFACTHASHALELILCTQREPNAQCRSTNTSAMHPEAELRVCYPEAYMRICKHEACAHARGSNIKAACGCHCHESN